MNIESRMRKDSRGTRGGCRMSPARNWKRSRGASLPHLPRGLFSAVRTRLVEPEDQFAVDGKRRAPQVESLAVVVSEGSAHPDPPRLLLVLLVRVVFDDENVEAVGLLS